ncbi:MAG: N-acetylmuramoyl-L-alanine amidase [Chloroflexota bacterium]|nr:N-acetylmuramoyl-L-alanine amidase [Chloroflexota bacterium]
MPRLGILLSLALLLGACGGEPTTPSPTVPVSSPAVPSSTPVPTAGLGHVIAAPGSESAVYRPNPGAIVVAIDPGHGGCLDWGSPNPFDNVEAKAEKAITLGIALALRERLEAEGITVVMTRDADQALAGDLYPPLGCQGPPLRDVNGDGIAGFGPQVPPQTLARDELQARLDFTNVARADVLLSIHIDAITDADGNPIPIARTETFYTDETPWGPSSTRQLAELMQQGLVSAMAGAGYPRQDRGTNAHNLYLVAPPLLRETAERPNRWAQPTRGALMPSVLCEVASNTLAAEDRLIISADGQARIADGLFAGLAGYFTQRPLAARIDALLPAADLSPRAVPGAGLPFWAVEARGLSHLPLRLTNTGQQRWSEKLGLLVGWQPSNDPYLRAAPATLDRVEVAVPPLAPGESVDLEVPVAVPAGARQVAWITLGFGGEEPFADTGSAPLQLASTAP